MTESVRLSQPSARGGMSTWLRHRARDLAPFFTLLVLVVFFSLATDLLPYRKDVRKYERVGKEVIIKSARIPTKERN